MQSNNNIINPIPLIVTVVASAAARLVAHRQSLVQLVLGESRSAGALHVWTDGVQWVVAESAESADRIAGWHLREWRVMGDEETVTYQPPGQAAIVTRTAAELVAEGRSGFYLACVQTLPLGEASHG